MHNLALALAGGGVKGAAHVGVFKALEEQNIKATAVAGTSAGALAGAFYACGYKADEILEIMTQKKFFKTKAITWSKAGVLDGEILFKEIEKHFKGKTFEDLDVELHMATTDIISGDLKVFNSGSLVKPLMATCAFPFVFAPIEIGDSMYSDGGIINNFPVELVSINAKHTLGIYVSPLRKITKKDLKTSLDVADRAYRITNRYESLKKLPMCTWTVHPKELENYGTFSMKKMLEIYELGYRYGKVVAKEMKEAGM